MNQDRSPSETREPGNVAFRCPRLSDGAEIHRLIGECPPLDVNSPYLYNILSTHFAGTCVVAESDGRIVGFVSGYQRPDSPETLFIWQVAVSSAARGQRLARRMIEHILERPALVDVSVIETTVSPSNTASIRVFESVARGLDAAVAHTPFMEVNHFPDGTHEEEPLIRIGPIPRRAAVAHTI